MLSQDTDPSDCQTAGASLQRSQLLLGGHLRSRLQLKFAKEATEHKQGKTRDTSHFPEQATGTKVNGITGTKIQTLPCCGRMATQRSGFKHFTGSCPTPSSETVSKGSVGLTLLYMCSSRLTQKGDRSEQQLCHSLVFLGIYIASLGKNKADFKLLPCSFVMHYEKVP